ncbi:MAG: hypothetical protein ACYDCQ_22670, partial [Dehalococcoidia bacterium]
MTAAAASPSATSDASPAPVPSAAPEPLPTRSPNDLLRFVSKTGEPLPQDYVPPDLQSLPFGLSDPAGLVMRHEAA